MLKQTLLRALLLLPVLVLLMALLWRLLQTVRLLLLLHRCHGVLLLLPGGA